jgi:hypothetical protein
MDKASAHKAEIVAKLSTAATGKHPSDETRAKMSAALKGRHLSDEIITKMKSRSISDETRAKISSAKMRQTKAGGG